MDTCFMSAADVAKFLGVSQSFAYKVVQTLNKEMKEKGFHTIAGKVYAEYFKEKYCYQRKTNYKKSTPIEEKFSKKRLIENTIQIGLTE